MKNVKKVLIWVLIILVIVFLFNLVLINDTKRLREVSSDPNQDVNLDNQDVFEDNNENQNQNQNLNPKVIIETNKGDITLELYKNKTPKTVSNFLEYVDSNFYSQSVFHRVIKGFMIQGGGFLEDGTKKQTNAPIDLEVDNNLKNTKGTIAMARTNDPNSATSQFFINTVDNMALDTSENNPGYAVFGKVTDGIDVVETIEDVNTTTKFNHQNWPSEDIIINKIYRK